MRCTLFLLHTVRRLLCRLALLARKNKEKKRKEKRGDATLLEMKATVVFNRLILNGCLDIWVYLRIKIRSRIILPLLQMIMVIIMLIAVIVGISLEVSTTARR